MNLILTWALVVTGPMYSFPLTLNVYSSPDQCVQQAVYYTQAFAGSGKMYYCEHKVIAK